MFALLTAATACTGLLDTEPPLPPDAALTSPLEEYAAWYAQVEECAGVGGDFGAVRWFEVPAERWWDPYWEQYAIGTWRAPHDIYISFAHLSNESVVKHEMVHDLLQGGAAEDPRFEECSGIAHLL